MNGSGFDGRRAGGGVPKRRVPQGKWRSFLRHGLESGAQGGVLSTPIFHQRRILRMSQKVLFHLMALLRGNLVIHEPMQISFLNGG